jgi:hypothetical protein
LADGALGDGEAWLTELDDEALRELVALRPADDEPDDQPDDDPAGDGEVAS